MLNICDGAKYVLIRMDYCSSRHGRTNKPNKQYSIYFSFDWEGYNSHNNNNNIINNNNNISNNRSEDDNIGYVATNCLVFGYIYIFVM